nr:PucC family protein [Anaerolineae bacterium]
VAMALGLVGLIRLEQRGHGVGERTGRERHSWSEMWRVIAGNRQARLFFFYLLLLLAAILGQDVLLEPYGGEAFGLSPAQTTRITSLWGVCVLLTLSLTGIFQARIPRRTAVLLGNWGALAGFILIAGSGLIGASSVFYGGVVLLGLGTGISTVSNLSLMLDMTTPQNVGLFIGAWGVANALSRLVGQVISGALRDLVAGVTGNAVAGYVIVFAFLVAFILVAQVLFRSVDVVIFRKRAAEQSKSLVEAVAMMHEAQG